MPIDLCPPSCRNTDSRLDNSQTVRIHWHAHFYILAGPTANQAAGLNNLVAPTLYPDNLQRQVHILKSIISNWWAIRSANQSFATERFSGKRPGRKLKCPTRKTQWNPASYIPNTQSLTHITAFFPHTNPFCYFMTSPFYCYLSF